MEIYDGGVIGRGDNREMGRMWEGKWKFQMTIN